MYTVYILKSGKDDGYYIGCTGNLSNRMMYHENGHSRATKFRLPMKLIYTEEFESKGLAFKRERQLKSYKNNKYLEYLMNKRP